MDDELDSGAYNPDLVEQQPADEGIAQSAPPDDAGEEPSTDGSGGQPPDDSAPPVPEGRKKERGWAGQIFDFLRDQFGVGEPGLSARGIGGSDHEPGGLPEQAGEEPEEQPGREPTGLPTQASMGREIQDEVPGQSSAQPSQMEAQPPVPYTGQPGQPDAQNPPRPMQYLQGHGAEDNATRTARENDVASRLPPGTDMNIVRSEALRQNMEQNGPEAAGPQLQNHRDQYNKFKAMAGAALDHGSPTNAASLYNDAHTFMPDGHKVTASPGANGGMNLNIQDLTGHKPPQDIQLSEDQFRELTHMRAGEFDHVFERGIDQNAADLAQTPGMPRGTFDNQALGVAKQFGEPYQDHTAWNISKQIANEAPYDPRPGHWQTQAEQPRGQNGSSRNVPVPGNGSYDAVARGERDTTVPQVQRMQPAPQGQGQPAPQSDTTSKGDYLRGQPRDQGFPMGDAALRPDPTSAENRAARALPNGTPEQLGRLADQYRAADRTMNDRLNAQVGPDPNADRYRAAPSGMPASSLNPSKTDLASRGLDLKEQEINRKTTQGNQHLDYLIDRNTGQLNERMMQHLDQANGRNISNAIRAAAAKNAAGLPLSAADNAALARAAELAMNPATHGALNTRPNIGGGAPPPPARPMGGGAPAPSGRGAAQPRGEWREPPGHPELRQWFPAQ